jgi:hypothetical protein
MYSITGLDGRFCFVKFICDRHHKQIYCKIYARGQVGIVCAYAVLFFAILQTLCQWCGWHGSCIGPTNGGRTLADQDRSVNANIFFYFPVQLVIPSLTSPARSIEWVLSEGIAAATDANNAACRTEQ